MIKTSKTLSIIGAIISIVIIIVYVVLATIYGFLLLLTILFVIALVINLILTIFALKTKTKGIFKIIYSLGIICLTLFNSIVSINSLNITKSC